MSGPRIFAERAGKPIGAEIALVGTHTVTSDRGTTSVAPVPTPESTEQPPASNQRERILDVALKLMSTRGLAGTSMRRLASACDLNVAAIYHYFDSKQDLFDAVIAERQYGSRFHERPPVDPSAPASARVTELFAHIWQGAMGEEAIWRLLLGEGVHAEPAALPVGTGLLEGFQAAVTEWITESIPEAVDPEALADLFLGQLLFGFMLRIFDSSLSDEVVIERASAALCRALP